MLTIYYILRLVIKIKRIIMTTQPKPPHVLIATPCYGSALFQTYYISNIRLLNEVYKRRTMNVAFSIRGGDSLITRLRNSITAEFLANDAYTHLLWIDADIGFEPDEVFRLVESGHDIACGMYPLKSLPIPDQIPTNGAETINRDEMFYKYLKYPFNPIGRQFDVVNDFVEVKDAPTGMMCIKREVFMKMIEQYPELKYSPDKQVGLEHLEAKINDLYYNFFDTMLAEDEFTDANGNKFKKKRYLSEDYAFCRLWQNMGGKVHAFARSKLSHTGLFTYQGDFEKHFRYNYNLEPIKTDVLSTAPNLGLNPNLGLKVPDLGGVTPEVEAVADDSTNTDQEQ